jgi:hypothetical protein
MISDSRNYASYSIDLGKSLYNHTLLSVILSEKYFSILHVI